MPSQIDPRVEQIALDQLTPYAGNPRTHSKKQVRALAASIKRFGFTNPLLVSDDLEVICGAGRLLAAQQLEMGKVPVIRLSHLSADERRAYVLADNQLGLISGWDREQLAIELQSLSDIKFDVPVIGFDTAELDIILDTHVEVQPRPTLGLRSWTSPSRLGMKRSAGASSRSCARIGCARLVKRGLANRFRTNWQVRVRLS